MTRTSVMTTMMIRIVMSRWRSTHRNMRLLTANGPHDHVNDDDDEKD